jgi:superfamily I DNA/RNA helicase
MQLPTFRQLSKEQFEVLKVRLDSSCVVTGPPGTGKTVLALYRGQYLQSRDEPVLVLMYGKLLRHYTAAATHQLSISPSVETFHSWFWKYYRNIVKENPPQVEPYVFNWDEILVRLGGRLQDLAEKKHMIVDEGQDLAPAFYIFAARIAGKTLAVFADENQQIKNGNSTIQEITEMSGVDTQLALTRNYRNTLEIAKVAQHFYVGLATGVADLPDRSGEKPRLVVTRDPPGSMDYVARWVKNHGDREVGVLVPCNEILERCVDALQHRLPGHRVEKYQNGDPEKELPSFGTRGVTVINYQSAKGLEFDAVFIPELQDRRTGYDGDEPTRYRMRMYVLCSRAREELHLLYSGGRDETLEGRLPDSDLLERA